MQRTPHFFYKKRKRKQRMQHSFIKNVKEHKKRSVLFIKKAKERENTFFWKECKKNARTLHSFEKNVCPTLVFGVVFVLLFFSSLSQCGKTIIHSLVFSHYRWSSSLEGTSCHTTRLSHNDNIYKFYVFTKVYT